MPQLTPGDVPEEPRYREGLDKVESRVSSAPTKRREFLGISGRYPALGILHQVIVAFGIVVSITGALGVIYVVMNINEFSYETLVVALTPLGTLLGGIVVAAFGQLLKVFMDIEANTRRESTGG